MVVLNPSLRDLGYQETLRVGTGIYVWVDIRHLSQCRAVGHTHGLIKTIPGVTWTAARLAVDCTGQAHPSLEVSMPRISFGPTANRPSAGKALPPQPAADRRNPAPRSVVVEDGVRASTRWPSPSAGSTVLA